MTAVVPSCEAIPRHVGRTAETADTADLLTVRTGAGDRPGEERVGRDEAELLEFLQSIGITLAPRGGTGGDGS